MHIPFYTHLKVFPKAFMRYFSGCLAQEITEFPGNPVGLSVGDSVRVRIILSFFTWARMANSVAMDYKRFQCSSYYILLFLLFLAVAMRFLYF